MADIITLFTIAFIMKPWLCADDVAVSFQGTHEKD